MAARSSYHGRNAVERKFGRLMNYIEIIRLNYENAYLLENTGKTIKH